MLLLSEFLPKKGFEGILAELVNKTKEVTERS
jgi:hypothetical protein